MSIEKKYIKENLIKWLKNARKIIIMGVGNPLRGDDVVGLKIAKKLEKYSSKYLKIIISETVPENFIGQIRKFKPSHLIIIDAVDFKGNPGDIRLILPEELSKAGIISTHTLPLSLLSKFLYESMGIKTIIIGIQPKSIDFGSNISPIVEKTIIKATKIIINVLVNLNFINF
ncbi:MAG: hydrogenase maturation peptidase HycI [Nitrososphaerota archaeon]